MPRKLRTFFISIIFSLSLLCPQILFAEIIITAIDVGQGDAVLIQHEAYNVLIDGGRRQDAVADYLKDNGISHIDLMVATHAHADHVGGLVGVLNPKSVGQVLYNGQTHTTLTFERFVDVIFDSGAKYHEPGRGEFFSLGAMEIFILHPEESAKDYGGHLHDKNIVVRIVYGDFAAIISGDIEHEGELEILNSGMKVSAQVLELGHHGSRTSNSSDWIRAVNPDFVFWQAGEDNQYGHPHEETIMILEELNIPHMGTATQGNITINADRDGSFSVNGRFFENKKEENKKKADELFKLLELHYPTLFPPPSQPTVESEGIFYRYYPDTGSIIGIIEGELYFVDDKGDIKNWGQVDYWFAYFKTEFIFDWLENQFPEILAPSSQLTVDAGEYFYRSYPDTNVMIASFQGDLYFIDNAGNLYNLGSIDEWLIQAGYYTN